MPRESVARDGLGVYLGEVDIRTIRRSCKMLRLKNNTCSYKDFIRYTRRNVCISKAESNLGVQIWKG